MSSPTAMVGPVVFPSSSQGLGAVAKEYLDRALMLNEEFLTGGLSQCIKEDEGPDLRHTIVRHALLTTYLSYKNMLESEDNDAKRRVIRDELLKTKQGLAVVEGREKELAVELEKLQAHDKALEMELKESVAALNEKQSEVERAYKEMDQA
ncbi:hypothetical protein ACOSP7_020947 [Xanthoceras sorbifolium]